MVFVTLRPFGVTRRSVNFVPFFCGVKLSVVDVDVTVFFARTVDPRVSVNVPYATFDVTFTVFDALDGIVVASVGVGPVVTFTACSCRNIPVWLVNESVVLTG